MNKKSQAEVWELTLLFEVIIGIVVAFFLLYYSTTFNVLSGYNVAYAEKDISFLTEAALSSPNDVKIEYPLSEDYSVSIGENISVTHKEGFLPKDLFNRKSVLIIQKKGEKLFFRREEK